MTEIEIYKKSLEVVHNVYIKELRDTKETLRKGCIKGYLSINDIDGIDKKTLCIYNMCYHGYSNCVYKNAHGFDNV